MTLSPQLALQIGLPQEATLENFCPRPGVLELLDALSYPDREPLSYLHGPTAAGKSHLLQGLCHSVKGAVYLPLAELHPLPPAELLSDLESAALLAIDDLDVIAAHEVWEESLFHLINRARQQHCPLWIAATRPADSLGVTLPDLRSRLAGGVTWAISPRSDAETVALLQFRADRIGLRLPEAVASYLCARESRCLNDLLVTLERLDEASLALQRPLTVPLVKSVMGW